MMRDIQNCFLMMVGTLALVACGRNVASRATPNDRLGDAALSDRSPSDSGAASPDGSDGASGPDAQSSDAGQESDSEADVLTSSFCGGAGWSTPDQIVAAAFSGLDLVVIDAAGRRRTAHSFGAPDSATVVKKIVASGGRLTASVSWNTGTIVAPDRGGESVRIDASGQKVWTLTGAFQVASDTLMGGLVGNEPRIVRADGTSIAVPVQGWDWLAFEEDPDAAGWMVVHWTTWASGVGNTDHYSVVKDDGSARELYQSPLSQMPRYASIGGKYVMLRGSPIWDLTFATPAVSNVVSVPFANDGSLALLQLRGGSSFGIVNDFYGTGLFRVDGSAETVVPIDASGVSGFLPSDGLDFRYSSGDWFLGTVTYYLPTVVYDGLTNTLEAVRLDRLAPLRPLDGQYCSPPAIFPDGRVGFGLRDDVEAAYYVGTADGLGWQRIGRPVRDILSVTGVRVAATWVVTAYTWPFSYCPEVVSYTGTPSSDAISGDSIQILAPGAPELVVASGVSPLLDPTGMCAAFPSPTGGGPIDVYDLLSGAKTELTGLTDFTFL
jgi:hypothetical protein